MKMTFYVANCRGNAKNSLYPKKCVVDNEDDCMEVMAFDHVCGEFKGCRRGNDNFISCDASVMDCDNSHSDNTADWITLNWRRRFWWRLSIPLLWLRSVQTWISYLQG